jgi:hypothetical protein
MNRFNTLRSEIYYPTQNFNLDFNHQENNEIMNDFGTFPIASMNRIIQQLNDTDGAIVDVEEKKSEYYDPLICEPLQELARFFKENFNKNCVSLANLLRYTPEEARDKSLLTTLKHYYHKNNDFTNSPDMIYNWYTELIEQQPDYLFCDLKSLDYKKYENVYRNIINFNFKGRLPGGKKIGGKRVNKEYLKALHKNLQTAEYDELLHRNLYVDGLNFESFMELPIELRKNVPLLSIPPVTESDVEAKLKAASFAFGIIIIFRKSCGYLDR